MIAFAFTFPAGRYHATPWGRNVNEADVAWPPEPVRILRALIATWWRKADHARFPKSLLDDLIDVLAVEPPVFQLPEAVHSHIRTFMPAPTKPPGTLIYDAFFRMDEAAEMIVAWPDVVLSSAQRELAAHLLGRTGYLGRAESWVDGRLVEDATLGIDAACRGTRYQRLNGTKHTVASDGRLIELQSRDELIPVDLIVPLSPQDWAGLRLRLTKSKKPARGKRRQSSHNLPERLCDALAVDTSEWQSAGWSSPPPMRKVVYDRPTVGPLPRLRRSARHKDSRQPGSPEVARYVLAGRPRPRIEDTLRIAEITRLALMSRSNGDLPPIELTGRDEDGPLRDDPAHAHAFYLPEDADGDGLIDHIIVYCRLGFSDTARRSLDRLTKLWIEHGRANEEGQRGRKEWRVALEDIAPPTSFQESWLLQCSPIWKSVTPYLKNRFDKVRPRNFEEMLNSYRDQISTEWTRRHPNILPPHVVALIDEQNRFIARIGSDGPFNSNRPRSTLAFARTRRGRGGHQPDTSGGFFQLVFEQPVPGPIALGWGAHFGLGMFRAAVSRP